MTRRLAQLALACVVAAGHSTWAWGQEANPDVFATINLPTRVDRQSDTGIRLDEKMLMHAGLGIEAGYDTNVFYSSSGDERASPIMLVVPFVEIANNERGGSTPGGVYYDVGASLLYREYLSSDSQVKAQRALNPTLGGAVEIHSGQQLSLGLSDAFSRSTEPPYAPGKDPFVRDNNQALGQINLAPGGGRIQGVLRLLNIVDIFENKELTTRNSMTNELMLDVSWRWLPKTAIFVKLRQGMVTYFHSGPSGSFPLRAQAGLRGLVTPKMTVDLAVGYANAFYSSGASTGGWLGSMAFDAKLIYNPTLLNQILLAYRHDFENSLVGNFYYSDMVSLGLRRLIGSRLQAVAAARYDLRRYQGADVNFPGQPLNRTDNVLTASLALDYGLRWGMYAGGGYNLSFNSSSGTIPTGLSLDYAKHQVFARMGIAY